MARSVVGATGQWSPLLTTAELMPPLEVNPRIPYPWGSPVEYGIAPLCLTSPLASLEPLHYCLYPPVPGIPPNQLVQPPESAPNASPVAQGEPPERVEGYSLPAPK